jgi:hypothetical protein
MPAGHAGHVSVSVELDADPIAVARRVVAVIDADHGDM